MLDVVVQISTTHIAHANKNMQLEQQPSICRTPPPTRFPNLHVFVGPMASGKTSRLLLEMEKRSKLDREVGFFPVMVLVQPDCSVRLLDEKSDSDSGAGCGVAAGTFSHSTIIHNGANASIANVSSPASLKTINADQASTAVTLALKTLEAAPGDNAALVVGIDEAQFFKKRDLVAAVNTLLSSAQVTSAFVAGLDGTFSREAFPDSGISRLLPMSTTFVKLCSTCKFCYAETGTEVVAPFTRRTARVQGSLIGGLDKCAPVCAKHWGPPPP